MSRDADMISIPHYCQTCQSENDCYHGILGFEIGGRIKTPLCDHHKKPGRPCHSKPVRMVPVGS